MFSVVIPLYNKAHTITRTLGTVLSQKYKDFEVVVVNDGSTDNGLEVIRNFTQDPRLRIIEQENQGVSAARNKGVASAKHEYIAFLDGDDEWKPDYLLKLSEAITKYPKAGMFCCAGTVRNADGSQVYRIAEKYKDQILEIDFFENPHVFLHTSAVIARKTDFEKAGGFPVGMVRNEDYAFFFTLALITPVVYCGFPLSVYVGGVPGQATSTPPSKVLHHIINRFNTVQDNFVKLGCKNRTYNVFNKYEVRHNVIISLRENNYESLNSFLTGLHPTILNMFSPVELKLYQTKSLRKISIALILLTKLRWRMRGYPRIAY